MWLEESDLLEEIRVPIIECADLVRVGCERVTQLGFHLKIAKGKCCQEWQAT
jgi:hypothetical protein